MFAARLECPADVSSGSAWWFAQVNFVLYYGQVFPAALEHVSSGHDCPIFTDAEISALRGIVEAFANRVGAQMWIGLLMHTSPTVCMRFML